MKTQIFIIQTYDSSAVTAEVIKELLLKSNSAFVKVTEEQMLPSEAILSFAQQHEKGSGDIAASLQFIHDNELTPPRQTWTAIKS